MQREPVARVDELLDIEGHQSAAAAEAEQPEPAEKQKQRYDFGHAAFGVHGVLPQLLPDAVRRADRDARSEQNGGIHGVEIDRFDREQRRAEPDRAADDLRPEPDDRDDGQCRKRGPHADEGALHVEILHRDHAEAERHEADDDVGGQRYGDQRRQCSPLSGGAVADVDRRVPGREPRNGLDHGQHFKQFAVLQPAQLPHEDLLGREDDRIAAADHEERDFEEVPEKQPDSFAERHVCKFRFHSLYSRRMRGSAHA